jgi:hypothetical protein
MRFALLGLLLGGCVIFPRSLQAPPNDETTVMLVSGTLGGPMEGIARHPWFAVRRKNSEDWQIYEVGGGGAAPPFTDASYGNPIVHKVWRGEEGERAADCVEKYAPGIASHIEANYIFYPGPNSNSFGPRVLRKCKLAASLSSTSVGKDWYGKFGFGAGITSERTGVQLETPIVGVRVGLKEGIELHVIGLSIGIDLWPPAIIVPIGPGRIGFADR